MNSGSTKTRRRIAREAANLLYSGTEKEFRQAKLTAARLYGARLLPTNLEVAVELDKLADEKEGSVRQERLIHMRQEALQLMRVLRAYDPLLVGSVWRGTIHHQSDIDIVVYHNKPENVLETLKLSGVRITRTEWANVTKKGENAGHFHIYVESSAGDEAEIKLSEPEEIGETPRCEIFGDRTTGLDIKRLAKLLKENPTQRFLPS